MTEYHRQGVESKPPRLTRKKFVVFAALAVTLSLVGPAVLLLAIDVYLHKRAEKSAGLNVWGYRGPVAGRKTLGEVRIAVLGGSTAFGYGISWDQAFPAHLERKLNARRPRQRGRVSVVNLAYNNEGAYSFKYTLQDYDYLHPDIVALYEGYNDLVADERTAESYKDLMAAERAANRALYRHDSPIFRLTGYFPIFPTFFNEKAMALLHGGDITAAYRAHRGEETVVFRPNLADRATAAALAAAVDISNSLNRQLARLSDEARYEASAPAGNCGPPWNHYCRSVYEAVEYALERGKQALVITQPYKNAAHIAQQRALASMLIDRYYGDPRVRYVNLGRTIDLKDPGQAYDGMHLTARGNEIVAERLVEPVLEMIAPRGSQ